MPVSAPPPADIAPKRAEPARPRAAPPAACVGVPIVAAAAGLLLAFAENWWFPAALTPAFALLSHLVVDRGGRWHLPVLAANILGLAALGFAATELVGGEIEGRLLFGAHLIVYLTWVVLCQRKTAKVCWSVLALSLLQVAVGSVLTASGPFGLGLFAFLGLAVWALVRLNARWPPARRGRPAPAAAAAGRASVVEPGEATAAETRVRALPAGLAVCLIAAPIGVACFLMVPRVWLARRAPMDPIVRGSLPAVTGFSGEVKLGDLGAILESTEPAFDVHFFDRRGGRDLGEFGPELVLGTDEPLFRGRVLTEYGDGRWGDGRRRTSSQALPPVDASPVGADLVQEYRLRPLDSQVLFSVGPAGAATVDRKPLLLIRERDSDGVLIRPEDLPPRDGMAYTLLSPPPYTARREAMLGLMTRRRLSEPSGLPAVAAEAEAALAAGPSLVPDAASRNGGLPDRVVADRLVDRLRDPAEFRYSLSGGETDDALDPVEDFLRNRRTGHCEFFASALALMLRERGIPSRLVTGFKGGSYNELAGRIEVEQRHAHAWVEAFIADGRVRGRGTWVTLDPTPSAARAASVARSGRRFAWVFEFANSLDALWTTYVVRMSLDRQKAAFLAPAQDLGSAIAGVFGKTGGDSGDGRRWFSGGAGVAAAVLLGLLAAAGWGVRRFFGGRWWAAVRAPAAGAERGRVLPAVCEAGRTPGRPPAAGGDPAGVRPAAAAALADALAPPAGGGPDLSGLPAAIAADLYAVRFGAAALPAGRAAELDAALDALAARIA